MSLRIKIFLILAVAVALRIYFATLGHNYDLESWDIVSDIVLKGDVIYAETERYNYSYLWGLILAALKSMMYLFGQSGLETFHIYIVVFLSVIDIAIAAWIQKYFGNKYALLFLFNPVSILITGFHSQFDNLALLFALLSVVPLMKSDVRTREVIYGALLLGISLMTKHLYFMFPLWFLFRTTVRIKHRILYGALSCGLFFMSFVPFMFDTNSLNGIINNIIHYKGYGTNSLFSFIMKVVGGDWLSGNFNPEQIFTLFKIIFLVCLGGLGFVFRKQSIRVVVIIYPLALLVTSCMMLSEYYSIVMVLVVLLIRHFEAKLFILFCTFYLIFMRGAHNLGKLETMKVFPQEMQDVLFYVLNPKTVQLFLALLMLRLVYLVIVKKRVGLISRV